VRRLVAAFKALTSQRTPKVDIVFKDGIQGLVRTRQFGVRRQIAAATVLWILAITEA